MILAFSYHQPPVLCVMDLPHSANNSKVLSVAFCSPTNLMPQISFLSSTASWLDRSQRQWHQKPPLDNIDLPTW
ncbi:hypothetical protein SOVF_124680 [Spinacia oleracea]|nr:hypothetical protein SOVF_124680 [Spinacia oleracea]